MGMGMGTPAPPPPPPPAAGLMRSSSAAPMRMSTARNARGEGAVRDAPPWGGDNIVARGVTNPPLAATIPPPPTPTLFECEEE